MASDKRTASADSGKVRSVQELETYGVWVKSEPQDLSSQMPGDVFAEGMPEGFAPEADGFVPMPGGFGEDDLPDFSTGSFVSGLGFVEEDGGFMPASFEEADFEGVPEGNGGAQDSPSDLLQKMADELSSLKSEIGDLKKKVAKLSPEVPEEKTGFFSPDSGEKVAFTDDEMDNILSSSLLAEKDGGGDPVKDDLYGSLREEDEAALREFEDYRDNLEGKRAETDLSGDDAGEDNVFSAFADELPASGILDNLDELAEFGMRGLEPLGRKPEEDGDLPQEEGDPALPAWLVDESELDKLFEEENGSDSEEDLEELPMDEPLPDGEASLRDSFFDDVFPGESMSTGDLSDEELSMLTSALPDVMEKGPEDESKNISSLMKDFGIGEEEIEPADLSEGTGLGNGFADNPVLDDGDPVLDDGEFEEKFPPAEDAPLGDLSLDDGFPDNLIFDEADTGDEPLPVEDLSLDDDLGGLLPDDPDPLPTEDLTLEDDFADALGLDDEETERPASETALDDFADGLTLGNLEPEEGFPTVEDFASEDGFAEDRASDDAGLESAKTESVPPIAGDSVLADGPDSRDGGTGEGSGIDDLILAEGALVDGPGETAGVGFAEGMPEVSDGNEGLADGPTDFSPQLKKDIKGVLAYMDQLLESLPEEKIEEFAKSEHFDTYRKIFKELGLV